MKFKSFYCMLLLIVINVNKVSSQPKIGSKEYLKNCKENIEVFGDSLKINVFDSWGGYRSSEDFFFLRKNDKWGLVNTKTNEIKVPFEIDSILVMWPYPSTVYNIKRNNKWESFVFDLKFNMVKEIGDKKNKTEILEKNYPTKKWIEVIYNGKIGYVDREFNVVLPIEYDCIHKNITRRELDVYDDFYLLFKKQNVGFFHKNKLIEPIYQAISTKVYRNGRLFDYYTFPIDHFCAKKNNKYGFLNFNEEVVLPFEYDDIYYCDVENNRFENIYVVKKGSKHGLISQKENLIPYEYEELIYLKGSDLNSFLFSAKKNGKFGLIDAKNNVLIPFDYESIVFNSFEEKSRNLIVKKNNLYGVIDINNNLIVPIENKSEIRLLNY